MTSLSPLGTFLTLSFLLPGMIIFSSVVLLFPESHALVENRTTFEVVAAVLVISFLNGHPVFICEIYVLDKVWDFIFPSFKLSERSSLLRERSKIISMAESYNIVHPHLDHVFGEFILFTNTSFWIVIVAVVRSLYYPTVYVAILANFL